MKIDESKIYTLLTADKVRLGSKGYFADTLKNMREVVDQERSENYGEIAEIKDNSYIARFKIKNCDIEESLANPFTAYGLFYLVEVPKEKKLRPYRDTDEMIEDFKKRFNVNVPPYAMPLIWIKAKGADKKYLIVRFASALTICHNVEVYTPTLEDLVEGYTYLDGSPCGIEE